MRKGCVKRLDKRDNLILIGFMGSGKTSTGIRLSYLMRCAFADTDKMIEAREKKSVSDIFAEEGEAGFRKKETQLLLELAGNLQGKILAAGGGTPLLEENRRLLKQIGTVVYLRIRPETVFERLKGDDTRPLLQCDDPFARICELMELRSALYEAASDVTVDVDGRSVEEVAAEILERCFEPGLKDRP